jgi:hypothetical protein
MIVNVFIRTGSIGVPKAQKDLSREFKKNSIKKCI